MTPQYASFDLPKAIAEALNDAGASQNHAPGHKVRGERLQAAHIVMEVLLRHLAPGTLCVGCWSPQGGFIPLDMAAIASEAGLCRLRCERAVVYLKKVGFVSVSPPQHYHNPVPYAGL